MTQWIELAIPFAELFIGVVLVGCTAGLFFATRTLAKETELLRKMPNEPIISVRLEPHPQERDVLELVLANEGKGPAKSLSCNFVGDPDLFLLLHSNQLPVNELSFIEHGIGYFAANQTFKVSSI